MNETWPPSEYPCMLIVEWACPNCAKLHQSEFFSGEEGDSDADSFDFHCECGRYFKKLCRVPTASIIRSGWKKL